MSIFSKRSAIALAYVTAIGALIATPSLAGVDTPTNTTAASRASPANSAHDGHGASVHRHHQRPDSWGWNQRRLRLRR